MLETILGLLGAGILFLIVYVVFGLAFEVEVQYLHARNIQRFLRKKGWENLTLKECTELYEKAGRGVWLLPPIETLSCLPKDKKEGLDFLIKTAEKAKKDNQDKFDESDTNWAVAIIFGLIAMLLIIFAIMGIMA